MSSKFPSDQSVKHTFEDSSYPLSVNYVHLWVLVNSGKRIAGYLAVEKLDDVIWDLIEIKTFGNREKIFFIGNKSTVYNFSNLTFEEFQFVCEFNSIHFINNQLFILELKEKSSFKKKSRRSVLEKFFQHVFVSE